MQMRKDMIFIEQGEEAHTDTLAVRVPLDEFVSLLIYSVLLEKDLFN